MWIQSKEINFFLLSLTMSSAAINHFAGHSEMREKNKDD